MHLKAARTYTKSSTVSRAFSANHRATVGNTVLLQKAPQGATPGARSDPTHRQGPRPSLAKCWNWVAHLRVGYEAIATEVVVILLFSGGLRLIRQFMHVAEAFCIWF
jgi:hypothetical protein